MKVTGRRTSGFGLDGVGPKDPDAVCRPCTIDGSSTVGDAWTGTEPAVSVGVTADPQVRRETDCLPVSATGCLPVSATGFLSVSATYFADTGYELRRTFFVILLSTSRQAWFSVFLKMSLR